MQCEANVDTCTVAQTKKTFALVKNNPELYKYLTLANILEPVFLPESQKKK